MRSAGHRCRHEGCATEPTFGFVGTGWGRTGKAVACVKHRAVMPLSLSHTLTHSPTHPLTLTHSHTLMLLLEHGRHGPCQVLPSAEQNNYFTEMCYGTEAGSYLRLIDSCITQLKAPGPSRTCNEIKEEEEETRPPW